MEKLNKQRSKHISYIHQDQKRLHDALVELIEKAFFSSGCSLREEFKIADLGCGRGELLEVLDQKGYSVVGLDFDPKCVELSQKKTKFKIIKGLVEDASEIFADIDVNMFIMSHVLEHTYCPLNVIQKLKRHPARWICLAVPNPVRPKIFFKYQITGRSYANKGHLYSWDRSHFTNFIENYCGLSIQAWSIDEVYSLPYIRKIMRLFGFLDKIEVKLLPKFFPYLSSTLIALCSKNHNFVKK